MASDCPPGRRVIIDTDPGVDDALAILMILVESSSPSFLSPSSSSSSSASPLSVEAIMTVHGNGGLSKTTKNSGLLLDMFPSLSIPVFQGCAEPFMKGEEDLIPWVGHGPDSLGGLSELLPEVSQKNLPQKTHAAVWLAEHVASSPPQSFDLLLLGPLTNLAMALKLKPEIATRFRSVTFMGGCHLGKGNRSPISEFNHFADPEAAEIVFQKIPNLRMISIELTRDLGHSWDWYRSQFLSPPPSIASQPLRKLVSEMSKYYYQVRQDREVYTMCDTVAAAVYLYPSIILESKTRAAFCETGGTYTRGATVVDWSSHSKRTPNVEIVLEVDQQQFDEIIEKTLSFQEAKVPF